jgi:hypothetical protein
MTVLMIGEYDDSVGVPFKVVPPCFQGADDGKEFTIVDLVVLFSRVKRLRKISTRVICSIFISLEQDCTGCNKRCIGG